MLRSRFMMCRFILSPLESTLNRFAEGKLVDSAIVSSFLVNQQPKIESLNDFVFVHRLVSSHRVELFPELRQYLAATTESLPIADMSSKGLSVVISTVADSGFNLEFLRACVTDIANREHVELHPRIIARICKGVSALAKVDMSVDDHVIEFLKTALAELDWADMKPKDLIQIISLASVHGGLVSGTLINRVTVLAPFFTDAEAHVAVNLLGSLPDAEEAVTAVKKNLIRTKSARNKAFKIEQPGLPEAPRAPHFQYVRKIDLR